MELKKIIPCLDIKDGQVVKGINFEGLRLVGNPVEMAVEYCRQGADELVALDIAATVEGRKTFFDLAKNIAENVDIPFTVGGGINELQDVEKLLKAGVTKVSINSAAIRRPAFISEIAKEFGSDVCTVAIDAQLDNGKWLCCISGGNISTDKDLFDWAKEAENLGASGILFTSKSHDGVKQGFPNDAYLKLHETLTIPVIASGGAGKMEDFLSVFQEGQIDAALAASVFHFGEVNIPDLKKYLQENGVKVRM
jgi:cyclase